MPRGDLWSRDELLVVLDLYMRKGHAQTDPEVAELAKLTGRSNYSIAMRLGNFMHVDPTNPNEGLVGGRNVCEPLFEEFVERPVQLSDEANLSKERLASNDRSR